MTIADHRTLGTWDYILLFLTLFISLMIGVYFNFSGGKQKTTKEYLLGDRSQGILPVALSLMASFMSAITLLGVSAETYMYGTMFLTIIGSYVLFTAVAAYLYLPVFFKLQATSAYEYLELRFGVHVRLVASLLYTFQMVLYMGVVLYAPSIALETLTGLPHNVSILAVGSVCTLYSVLGGIKAVIWTDVFQSMLMYMALFSIIGVAAWIHGGFLPIWNIAKDHQRIQFFDFTLDPTVRHTTWSLFVGGGFTFLSLYAVNQTQVQRYLTMKDHQTAVKSLWISLPLLYLLLVACGFAGLSIFSVYADCDPLKAGILKQKDQLMPQFVMDKMGHVPGLSGLFAAGIFSASLSSVSACVNSLAAVTVEDYFKRLFPRAQISGSAALSKCVALLYGVACVAVAYLAEYLGGLLQAGLSILGLIGGPLLGTFTLGMFLPAANQPGALVGIVTGLGTILWISLGQPKPKPIPLPSSTVGCLFTATNLTTTIASPLEVDGPYLYKVSYLLYVVIGCFVTILVGWGVSLLASYWGYQPPQPPSPDLFTPPVANYLRHKQKTCNDMALQEVMLKKNGQIKS